MSDPGIQLMQDGTYKRMMTGRDSGQAADHTLSRPSMGGCEVQERRRILLLIGILTSITAAVTGLTLLLLYRTAFQQQRERVAEIAQSQARLIQAVARFDRQSSARDLPGGAFGATFSQIAAAYAGFEGIGKTGEFTLARRDGDRIVFLLGSRLRAGEAPGSVSFLSGLAEPMRRALQGRSGTLVGLDYRGVKVLAAHEALPELGLGIVAKIDLDEVRAPFVRAGVLASGIGLTLILLGTMLILVIGRPMIRRLETQLRDLEKGAREREKVEEALRDSEETFRTISAHAQDAVIMMDHEGKASFWNEAAVRLLGWSADEVIGKDVHQLLAPRKYRSAYQEGVERFGRTGEGPAVGKTLELSALRKDGSEFPIEISVAGVKVRGRWNAIGIVRDITERKRVEEALREAKEAAECAARAKSQFVARMSHEIRTPMNGIMGMNSLLLDTELGAEQRQYAESVRDCAQSLLGVLNDILDFSKVDAGRLELERVDFDLGRVLDEVGDTAAVKAQEKGLEYACVVDPGVPSLLRGDPGRLRQVLINLVGNAVKFTPQGEVAVRVAVKEREGARVTILFSVADTGVGVPPDRVGFIFDAFTQADASTTRRYGGTGLGLTICRHLVELMGGEMGVETEEGKGSTFQFTAVLETQPAGDGTALETDECAAALLRGRRVLVVDDSSTSRLVLQRHLDSWGCRHDEASSGEIALEKLRWAAEGDEPFDVALLDMRMPGMDGNALRERIHGDEGICGVRLVSMALLMDRGDGAPSRTAGFSARLTKPVKRKELHSCLVAALDQRVGGHLPARGAPAASPGRGQAKQRGRVLVVEDNRTNQIVAVKLLEKMGYRTDGVASGRDALEALEHGLYDLVLMDIEMPGMDGFETTRWIRDVTSSVRDRDVPIVAMTAHAMVGDRERCLNAGMNDYVSKPIDRRELAEVIGRWLPDRAPADPPSGPPPSPAEPEVFDRLGLMDRLDGDEELLGRLLAVFLDDAPGRIDALEEAARNRNAAAVRRGGHSLRSASGNVGAVALAEAACRMEQAGQAGDLDAAASLVGRVREEFERLEKALAAPDPAQMKDRS